MLAAALTLIACGGDGAPPAAEPTPVPASPTPQPLPEGPGETPAEMCVDATITGEVEVRLVQRDYRFSPACVVVLGGQRLRIVNRGTVVHNFTMGDVDLDVEPGGTATTEAVVTVAGPGTTGFLCKYHRDRGMEGEVTITAAG